MVQKGPPLSQTVWISLILYAEWNQTEPVGRGYIECRYLIIINSHSWWYMLWLYTSGIDSEVFVVLQLWEEEGIQEQLEGLKRSNHKAQNKNTVATSL